ncbi:hypothetical protein HZA55_00620 [Candidatus Poribacteria bacterium]|nr:hypothetical protein [Candidatus Poribacteria bacterium]
MPYTLKEQKQQRILIWITVLPIVLSMAIPMLFNYVETVLLAPTLY